MISKIPITLKEVNVGDLIETQFETYLICEIKIDKKERRRFYGFALSEARYCYTFYEHEIEYETIFKLTGEENTNGN